MQHKSRWAVAGIVALVCAVAGVLIANFVGGETRIERRIERLYPLDDPRFVQELGVLLGPPFLPGNRAQALLNGDEIFPPMLAAIRGAQVSITFETYIYWSGDIGRRFADALAERARAGVKVHVLLDWVGSAKMDESLTATMKEAGVQVQRFHPPHWSNGARRAHHAFCAGAPACGLGSRQLGQPGRGISGGRGVARLDHAAAAQRVCGVAGDDPGGVRVYMFGCARTGAHIPVMLGQ